ncbi:MAG: hypothetical protein Q7K65_03820 [Candidatus Buchananbacteria bacterium]|nr:hypothetical protein [Candidatus Buchananbacteria bacterium]
MKVKFIGLLQTILVTVILAGIWLAYCNYFLSKNPDGTYRFVDNISSETFLTIAILASALIFYMLLYSFKRYLSKRKFSKVTSQLADDLCRLYLDDNFKERCSKFGLEMGFEEITIKPEILNKCSVNSLARLITFVFYKNALSNFDFDKILESLASLIIKNWTEERIEEFTYVFGQDLILGTALCYLIERQKINQEADEFNKSINDRLDVVEKMYAEEVISVTNQINSQFHNYGYLAVGGSALKRWLFNQSPLRYFFKPVLVK